MELIEKEVQEMKAIWFIQLEDSQGQSHGNDSHETSFYKNTKFNILLQKIHVCINE